MAYNNYFPAGYQYYQPQQQNNGITWVQGEAAAKSWFVPPNHTVDLWDSEAQVIYLKSADASGMPSMKIIDYTIRDTQAPKLSASSDSGTFITRDELNAVNGRIDALKEELEGLRKPTKKKEES